MAQKRLGATSFPCQRPLAVRGRKHTHAPLEFGGEDGEAVDPGSGTPLDQIAVQIAGNLSQNLLRSIVVPLPPLVVQRCIVSELETERRLVEGNRELIARMEATIRAKLAEVWDEEPAAGKGFHAEQVP